ncbi:hypothetical protein M419DRAFT_91315 [Trichoderma reesei RUT C-30]|uniref:Zn(2)-C6 fungal-type domain-containing protein n=1 Tax=Hypocrea jecorina (strain ATCC 56765 / BCRC 32924 / NRRL 11460 / Rut C-30) TaxID=1344414 RepID=A0A024RZA4_HYPJR|nr:hypothetical protein M419DRAFT_91315 [Trichoderma reesei RUT C-30]
MSAVSTEKSHPKQAAETTRPTSLNRTCEGCRQRKIRCIIESSQSISPPKCARCSKFNLDCIFLPPAIRRRRNKNETRIKELEQKLQQLQDAIAHSPAEAVAGNAHSEGSHPDSVFESFHPDFQQPSTSFAYSLPPETFLPTALSYSTPEDSISTGLVSPELADDLFTTFFQTLAPIYPLVQVPSDWTWQQTRYAKPALFRAILTAASSDRDPAFFMIMFRNTGMYVTEEVSIKGNKSLDLIQALLVLSAWYCPMEDFRKLKFSHYANLAGSMALDLRSSNDEQYWIPPVKDSFASSEQLVETCRTFLASYFLCSSMAFSYRRPSILRYGPWVDDCIRVLEAAPTACLNDRRLIEWTKLQIIAEECMSAAGLDNESNVCLADDRVGRVLKHGIERAISWKHQVSPEIIHKPMVMHYHMVLISLNEPAFYDAHDMQDFRPPYRLRPLPLAKSSDDPGSIAIANSLAQCVSSAQTVINTFLGIPTETLRVMPVIVYTRITYAAVTLIKFDVSARMLQSVACMLDDIHLSPKVLLLQLLDKLIEVAGSENVVVPVVFRGALARMMRWYVDQLESFQEPDQDEVLEPMMYVGVDAESSSGLDVGYGGAESQGSVADPNASFLDPLRTHHVDYL